MTKRTKPTAADLPDGNVVPINIPKPIGFLEKFKSKKAPTIGGVESFPTALPHHKIADANDFVRLHPNEDDYWTPELCFTSVPIKGEKRDMLHVIDEEIAMRYLPAKKILRYRLALATKPHDAFFLCHVPTQNLDNTWNSTTLIACEKAKRFWVQAASRKAEGVEGYKIDYARDVDAFPEPNWPTRSLEELLAVTFHDCQIEADNHPALLRLIGAKQSIS
ncbi:hypothetical protein HU230_0008870 [Bradyrhizobium quebecense]|uniref:Uncharacterized protein n=1 Tax=Bradyrhizobium quebecense TaxID=2748629 RepID=A0A973WPC7_9BRAD|nr:hypothetical protein [Bradyrhizobium quebecense]UGA46129.1 hypothetical protein HU230_0008870 [Bradyrhizobium quebecense]